MGWGTQPLLLPLPQLEAPPRKRGGGSLCRASGRRGGGATRALDAVLVLRRCFCVLLVLESTLDDLGLAAGALAALNPLDVLVILRPHPPRHGIGASRTWAPGLVKTLIVARMLCFEFAVRREQLFLTALDHLLFCWLIDYIISYSKQQSIHLKCIHLESCTPGQDRAKWYIPVRTRTYQYNTV